MGIPERLGERARSDRRDWEARDWEARDWEGDWEGEGGEEERREEERRTGVVRARAAAEAKEGRSREPREPREPERELPRDIPSRPPRRLPPRLRPLAPPFAPPFASSVMCPAVWSVALSLITLLSLLLASSILFTEYSGRTASNLLRILRFSREILEEARRREEDLAVRRARSMEAEEGAGAAGAVDGRGSWREEENSEGAREEVGEGRLVEEREEEEGGRGEETEGGKGEGGGR